MHTIKRAFYLLGNILPGLILATGFLLSSDVLAKGHWWNRSDETAPTVDFWSQLRQNFAIECDQNNPEVQRHIRWYQEHPRHLHRILQTAAPFIHYVYEQTKRNNLPAELALIPIIESQYNPAIGAHSGAAGLWQMMPGTATKFGLKINHTYDGRRDVSASTRAALHYLTYLHRYFGQNWLLALAAYNVGEGTIMAMTHGSGTTFWNLPLSKGPREYVPKILAIASIIKRPEYYNVRLPIVSAENNLQEMAWNETKVIDLTEAAKTLGISDNVLRHYNPGIRKNIATIPGTFTLLVPSDFVPNNIPDVETTNYQEPTAPEIPEILPDPNAGETTQLAQLTSTAPTSELIEGSKHTLKQDDAAAITTYKIKKGDTLAAIAKKVHCPLAALKKANHLTSNKLKIGKTLQVPSSHSRKPSATTQNELPAPLKTVNPTKQEKQTHKTKKQNHSYKVLSGDTLSGISKKVHVTTKHLKATNHLKNEAQLKIGQTLSY